MTPTLKTTAAGDDDLLLLLPTDIGREILSRLPVKSILRCRSVCRSWYSFISCPNFIDRYSIRNLNKNGNRVLLQTYDDHKPDVWSYISYDDLFKESHEHNYIPSSFLDRDIYIKSTFVGTCNGLVCLRTYHEVQGRITSLIWNPTIRKIVELPCQTYTHGCASYCGFGFDSKTSDYKVLSCTSSVSGQNVCEIFDMRKGVWRAISPKMNRWYVCGFDPECYLDGVVHWSEYERRNNFGRILLSFNMSDECFREMKMPDFEDFVHGGNNIKKYTTVRSMASGGLIHVMVWKATDDGIMVSTNCSIWVMREYGVVESWTKMSNIEFQRGQIVPTNRFWPHEFHLWKNSEILMVYDLRIENKECVSYLFSYDIGGRQCKRLFSTSKHISNLCICEESLVFM